MDVKVTIVAKRTKATSQRSRGAVHPTVSELESSLAPWTAALLDCLRPTCRSVFVLRELGWRGSRIADLLGISKQRVHALHAEAVASIVAAARRATDLAVVARGQHRHAEENSKGQPPAATSSVSVALDAAIPRGLLELPTTALGLGPRAQNALARASISTIAALVCMPRARLSKLWGLGPKALGEIETALAQLGLRLDET